MVDLLCIFPQSLSLVCKHHSSGNGNGNLRTCGGRYSNKKTITKAFEYIIKRWKFFVIFSFLWMKCVCLKSWDFQISLVCFTLHFFTYTNKSFFPLFFADFYVSRTGTFSYHQSRDLCIKVWDFLFRIMVIFYQYFFFLFSLYSFETFWDFAFFRIFTTSFASIWKCRAQAKALFSSPIETFWH